VVDGAELSKVDLDQGDRGVVGVDGVPRVSDGVRGGLQYACDR